MIKIRQWIGPLLGIVLASSAASAATPPPNVASGAYSSPMPVPFEPSLDMFTLAELVSAPATRAMLESIDPALVNSGIHKFLGYYTLPQLRNFFPKAVTPENLARINQQLATLPRGEWPVK